MDPGSLLRQREPFRFVDRLVCAAPGRAVAELLVSAGGLAPMLVLEALAQTCALVPPVGGGGAGAGAGADPGQGLLAGFRDVRLGRPARPGERLRLCAERTGSFGRAAAFRGVASVGEEELAAGVILISAGAA